MAKGIDDHAAMRSDPWPREPCPSRAGPEKAGAGEAGAGGVHLRRGSSGHLWADDPEAAEAADRRIDTLTEWIEIAAA